LATNVLTKYQDAEETAKSKGIGMWADQNVEIPGEYRQRVKKLIALKYGKEIDILD
jgi:endonuclease YncB( thermonuclease family)